MCSCLPFSFHHKISFSLIVQLQSKHEELKSNPAVAFPNSSDGWMSSSGQNDPLSEFVLKRKLELEVCALRVTKLLCLLSNINKVQSFFCFINRRFSKLCLGNILRWFGILGLWNSLRYGSFPSFVAEQIYSHNQNNLFCVRYIRKEYYRCHQLKNLLPLIFTVEFHTTRKDERSGYTRCGQGC